MRQSVWAAIILAAAVGSCRDSSSEPPARCYAGAGLQRALDAAAAAYAAQTGRQVQVEYGGSGMIMSRARLDKQADLFIPGDAWYVDQLEQDGLIESRTTIARLTPVILVPKGNPRGIHSLQDLVLLKQSKNERFRLALGDERACQVGRASRQLFENAGLEVPQATMHAITVNELAVWVVTGRAEAAIVWDAIAAGVADQADAVPIPADQNVCSQVVVGLMKSSPHPQRAREFVEFLTSPAGRQVLIKNGYVPEEARP